MATTKFIESGTAATRGFEFWTATFTSGTGTVTSDAQAVAGSVRSIKSNSGATGDATAEGEAYKDGVLNDVGRRFSLWIRFTGTISATGGGADFVCVCTSGGLTIFSIGVSNAGKLVLLDGSGALLATGTTVLSASTDYRISCAYTITSTTVNTITIYLNGTSEIAATNKTIGNTNSTRFQFGSNNNGWGNNVAFYAAHFFVDDGTTGDPGNIKVTAKLPFANGTTNGFSGSGTPSGYGSGNARYVNERPLNTANFVSVVAVSSAITEEYNIEGSSVGDVDISSATIVDYTGWLYTKALAAETGKIIVNNVQTNISITSTATLFTQIAGSTTYPAGTGTDIGEITATTATTITLYEAGIIVAYIPAVATGGNNWPTFWNNNYGRWRYSG